MVSTYSRLTLDIIGITALGVDLQNLNRPSTFHECYTRVFDPPPLGQVLLLLNAFIPVRWIPLRENRLFERANDEVRRLVRDIVRERIRDFNSDNNQGKHKDKEEHWDESLEKEVDALAAPRCRDLLSYLVEEVYSAKGATPWTEEEILGHASGIFLINLRFNCYEMILMES